MRSRFASSRSPANPLAAVPWPGTCGGTRRRRGRALGAAVALLLLPQAGVVEGQEGTPTSSVAAHLRASVYDPYERVKNGPPLAKVFHKVRVEWLISKLLDPSHDPAARMPAFGFTGDEAVAIAAYLKEVAGAVPPSRRWPRWASETLDEMGDDEFDEALALVDRGSVVWARARCTICHTVNGPRGELIGGFVDLRVGGIDLQIAAAKLRREWLYEWLVDPQAYFPDTLMPRYRFTDPEIRGLVEFILRDDAFRPATAVEEGIDAEPLDDPELVAAGRRLITLARCVVCHDIPGIEELLPAHDPAPAPPPGSFAALSRERRCLACHRMDGRGGSYAPDLTAVGDRLREDWIAGFLESPNMIRPLSQQMPRFNLNPREARTAAAFLASYASSKPGAPEPAVTWTAQSLERGRAAFEDRGCAACHTTGLTPGGGVGPSLEGLADRMRPAQVRDHLLDPHAVDPLSAEPAYALAAGEADDLSGFLLSLSARSDSTAVPPAERPELADQDGGLTATGGARLPSGNINRRLQARRSVMQTPSGVYGHYCEHCHGSDGSGNGRLWASELTPAPADLRSFDGDEAQLVAAIRDGSAARGRSSLCPPWGYTLSPSDITRLARHIRTLGAGITPTAGPSDAPRQAESSEAGADASESPPGSGPLLATVVLELVAIAWLYRTWKDGGRGVP